MKKVLKPCQKKAYKEIMKLVEKIDITKSKENIILLSAPTGSGKTTVLTKVIDDMKKHYDNYTFLFITLGKGGLEEQALKSFKEDGLEAYSLNEVLSNIKYLKQNTVCSVNWEKLVNKKNLSLITTDKSVSFEDAIKNTREKGSKIVLIIDEEHHSSKTINSKGIINIINPDIMIRCSATPNIENLNMSKTNIVTITEQEAINDGLLTKNIYLNYGITKSTINNKVEDTILIDAALKTLNEINKAGESYGIKSLIMIQFSDSTKAKPTEPQIKEVLDNLSKNGLTVENGEVAIWMSDNGFGHQNTENIKDYNGPSICLFKQALATGWDCPRAHILVKLREKGDVSFSKQTLGRIRRVFPFKDYDGLGLDILNSSFVFTSDIEYTNGLLAEYKNNVKETVELEIKEEFKYLMDDINLPVSKVRTSFVELNKNSKEYINLIKDIRLVFEKDGFIGFTSDISKNKSILKERGFIFSLNSYDSLILNKKVENTDELDNIDIDDVTLKYSDSKLNGKLYNVYERLGRLLAINNELVEDMCIKLFFKSRKDKKKNSLTSYLELTSLEYKYFIVNNDDKLIKLFSDYKDKTLSYKNGLGRIKDSTLDYLFNPKASETRVIKNKDFDEKIYTKSIYKDFKGNQFVSSKPEKEFFDFIEDSKNTFWFYKNEDRGTPYFSVGYYRKIEEDVDDEFKYVVEKPANFYPDVIFEAINGHRFIVEIKGFFKHENSIIRDEDIDKQSLEKFIELKKYEVDLKNKKDDGYKYHVGFVRPFQKSDGSVVWLIATEEYKPYKGLNGESDDNWMVLDDYLESFNK